MEQKTHWRCRACLMGNFLPQFLHLKSFSSVQGLWCRLWRWAARISSLGKLLSHSKQGWSSFFITSSVKMWHTHNEEDDLRGTCWANSVWFPLKRICLGWQTELCNTVTHFNDTFGVFAVFIFIFDVLLLLFFLLLLHVAVQVADQELCVRLYVVHSQVKDVLSILRDDNAVITSHNSNNATEHKQNCTWIWEEWGLMRITFLLN